MRITGLHGQRRHSGRANLHVDDAFHCGIAWELVVEHGLHVGDEVSAGLLERLRAADERWQAKQSALTLLATRGRARRELSDRLGRKGFGPAAVEYALAEVERLGFIDDRTFAEAWVRDRLRARPRGSRALLAELARKGVARETARAAVAHVMAAGNTDEAALCRQAAAKWLRTKGGTDTGDADERRRRERRLAAYLARRGFGSGEIRTALSELTRA